ncbi:hypothetical protein [Niastella vici]|nr:hypothetical protein [Niastella vici]
MNWINPKIIIGNTATGDYYYDRPEIIGEIWQQILIGNHVLLAAPRRVGKSSIMKHMIDNTVDNYRCKYQNVQGLDSAEHFFKSIYELIKSCMNFNQKASEWLRLLKETGIEEVSITGTLKIRERSINFLEAVNQLLLKLKQNDYKIVFLIDELPEVLHNLNKNNNKEDAVIILKTLRRWRQEDQFSNFRLVLAGSIGIYHVIKTIEGRNVDCNDFHKVKFAALTNEEAIDYILWATGNKATIRYTEVLMQYLLSKIQYCLPYFINLMLDEINSKARKNHNPAITVNDIDRAFDEVVKNSDHFKDWKSRLFDYMPLADAEFVNEVLIFIAHKNTISMQKLYDIAIRHGKKDTYMDFIDGLEEDGYITEENNTYFFVSPFLQAFWKRNNPVYHG